MGELEKKRNRVVKVESRCTACERGRKEVLTGKFNRSSLVDWPVRWVAVASDHLMVRVPHHVLLLV